MSDTTKKCVSCLKDFTDESLGMGGVFKHQAIAAGVCPECERKGAYHGWQHKRRGARSPQMSEVPPLQLRFER